MARLSKGLLASLAILADETIVVPPGTYHEDRLSRMPGP